MSVFREKRKGAAAVCTICRMFALGHHESEFLENPLPLGDYMGCQSSLGIQLEFVV